MLQHWPDLLLLLIPRHPERGEDVAKLVGDAGLSLAQRSVDQLIRPDTQVYIADTLGETGTWYALCHIVFLGGSLKEIGGHNPYEPVQAGAAVITGPGYFNFAETFEPLVKSGGAVRINSANTLSDTVALWLSDASELHAARMAANACVKTQKSALDTVIDTLCTRLHLG